MKKSVLTLILLASSGLALRAQVVPSELTGTWVAVGMTKVGSDTVMLLDSKDTATAAAFKGRATINADFLSASTSKEDQLAAMMIATRFSQFGADHQYAEGTAKDKTFKASKTIKKGNWTLEPDNKVLTTAIGSQGMMNSELFEVGMEKHLLKIAPQNNPSIVIYLKKISPAPLF